MTPEDPAVVPVKKKSPVKRFFFRISLWFLFLLIIAGTIGYFVCNYTYSEGNRAGLLLKFTSKGYVFKTFEGEINMGGINPMPGNTIANNLWNFSVKDKAVAAHLMELEGKLVKVHYKEHVRNLPWQGETKYFVDDVEELK